MTQEELDLIKSQVISELKNEGLEVTDSVDLEKLNNDDYILALSDESLAKIAPSVIWKRIQGTSSDSNSRTDPFRMLGYESYEDVNEGYKTDEAFNSALDALLYNNSVVGYNQGFFRARVRWCEVEIQNIVLSNSSSNMIIVQIVKGAIKADSAHENITKDVSGAYAILYRQYKDSAWGEWKEAYQDKLVSGTNIKTINGESILGEGNITISGGDGGNVDLSSYVTDAELATTKDDLEIKIDSQDQQLTKLIEDLESRAIRTIQINGSSFSPNPEEGSGYVKLPFKTINKESIVGSGNIEIKAADGGITSESDPIFMASPAAEITAEDIEAWNNKSDFSGNYNDLSNKPTIPSAVTESTVSNWGFTKNNGTVTSVKINGVTKSPNASGVVDLGYIESGGGTTVINGVTDVIVDGVTVVSDDVATIPLASTSVVGVVQLSNAVDSDSEIKAASSAAVKTVNDKVNGKQDTISDIAEIRTNAANAFKGSINGVSEGSLWFVTKINGIEPNSEGAVTIDVGDDNVQSDWNATSGDAYIKNKPTIPAAVTEDTVTNWGFTKNTGTYSKPTGGIPYNDLDSNVQEMLGKANMAIDRIVMNGVDYAPESSATHIDIGTVITGDDSVQHILGGLVVGSDETPSAMQDEKHVGRIVLTGVENPLIGLLDNSNGAVPFYLQAYENELYVGQTRGKAIKINSSGNVTVQKALTVAGTISEGGTALSNKYQAKLVSGTNIKTINNQSILGSGNIVANAYPLVSHGTSDTTFTLTPNTFHVWGIVSSLTLTFGSETEGVANEYLFQFSCSSSVATTLSLPSSVMWADGETPTIEVMKTYQVSILNNCATIQSFG